MPILFHHHSHLFFSHSWTWWFLSFFGFILQTLICSTQHASYKQAEDFSCNCNEVKGGALVFYLSWKSSKTWVTFLTDEFCKRDIIFHLSLTYVIKILMVDPEAITGTNPPSLGHKNLYLFSSFSAEQLYLLGSKAMP